MIACIVAACVAYVLLGFVTWILFAAIMRLRDRLPFLPPITQRVGKYVLGIGYLFDFTFNVLSSVPFAEFPPREWLFTDRVRRHLKPPAQYQFALLNFIPNRLAPMRLVLARWFRDNWLDCVDPNHCE